MTISARCALLYFVALIPVSASTGPALRFGVPEYRQLVADYRHQDFASVRRAAALSESDVQSSIAEATDASNASTVDDVRAAAMLHTDASAQLLTSGQSEAAFLHLNAATRLIDATTLRDQPSRRFASIWYVNVPGMLSKLGAPAWARQIEERRHSVVPGSAGEGALQKGLDFEIGACEQHEMNDGFGMRVSASLRTAVTFFEQALREDPSLHTAALHLGRARLLQGSLDQAQQNLDVATRSALASERYLALLLLGAIAEQKGRLEEAETRYRAAVVEFKWGQSGPLALARLLSRTDREPEARDVVAALLRRSGRIVDPLWTHLARPGREPMALLDLLRAEIWQ
jgi:tetratricopeptide (TPR) repeat protein